MSTSRITIQDVARRAGVAKSTVSQVLNGRPPTVPISEATRQRVRQAATDLDYRPSFSARTLANGRTHTIGLQCGNIGSSYYGELATLVMREAEAHGYHLAIQVTPWKNAQNDLDCLEVLLQRGVEGVLFFGSALQPGVPMYERLVKSRFPIVLLNEQSTGLPWVTSDYASGMEQAVAHLRQAGLDRIGYLKSAGMIGHVDAKELAFAATCRRHRVKTEIITAVPQMDTCRRAGREFAGRADRPRAVIANSDQAATGFIRGLRDGGLDVPRDCRVAGIDGTLAGEFLCPQLSTIAHDHDGIVKHAMHGLIQMIEGKSPPQNRLFPTRFVIRESA
ncbi:MAG: LacI family DNA-binding transcriptional regulator [Lentisphaeria bacterium]